MTVKDNSQAIEQLNERVLQIENVVFRKVILRYLTNTTFLPEELGIKQKTDEEGHPRYTEKHFPVLTIEDEDITSERITERLIEQISGDVIKHIFNPIKNPFKQKPLLSYPIELSRVKYTKEGLLSFQFGGMKKTKQYTKIVLSNDEHTAIVSNVDETVETSLLYMLRAKVVESLTKMKEIKTIPQFKTE